jgi:hypothetical protein
MRLLLHTGSTFDGRIRDTQQNAGVVVAAGPPPRRPAMWSLSVILCVAALSYSLCNVRSGNVLTQAICPMVFTLSLVALALWVYLKASTAGWRGGDGGGSASDGSGPSSHGDSGGDGGGGD